MKVKRGSAAAPSGVAAAENAAVLELKGRIAALEAELAAQRQRVAELEALRRDVLNRIDWAIDSLHNVLESEA